MYIATIIVISFVFFIIQKLALIKESGQVKCFGFATDLQNLQSKNFGQLQTSPIDDAWVTIRIMNLKNLMNIPSNSYPSQIEPSALIQDLSQDLLVTHRSRTRGLDFPYFNHFLL